MAIPDYQTLMLPVLRACATVPRQVREITAAVSAEFELSEDERQQELPSGRGVSVIHSRVGWAKTYLKQAGLLRQPKRGVVEITAEGLELLASGITGITGDVLDRYPSFVDFKSRSKSESSGATAPTLEQPVTAAATPEELIDRATADIEASLRQDLLARLLIADPRFFERVVVDVMLAMGYGGSHKDAGRRLGQSGDGGVDGVINEDRLGLDRIYLQAKRYAADVIIGRPMIQAFVGALHGQGALKGVFITTSSFSKEAREYARALGGMRVVLMDGDALARHMVAHDVGVRMQREVILKRLDEDYFESNAD